MEGPQRKCIITFAHSHLSEFPCRILTSKGQGKKKKRMAVRETVRTYLESVEGSLMLVATVIATMTFQIAINPPGGVWQSDSKPGDGCANNETCKAGTSVLAFSDGNQKSIFEIFVLLCTISFSASQTVILLLVCGFPLKNRVITWLLIIAICISVLCTSAAYLISIRMVMNPADGITWYYGVYWVCLVVLLCLIRPRAALYFGQSRSS